jgi:hypothetical protein
VGTKAVFSILLALGEEEWLDLQTLGLEGACFQCLTAKKGERGRKEDKGHAETFHISHLVLTAVCV